MGVCCPFLQPWDRARNQFLINLPCLSDPVRRSSLLLKLALVVLHLVFIGFLFLFDAEFIEKTKRDPWYMGCYLLLFSATLLQYFVTSGSSPGYVVDAMRDVCETSAMYRNPLACSIQHASRKSESVVVNVEGGSASCARRTPTPWGKLVLDLYPPGTSIRNLTCGYCHVEQPPRTKHCHDCDRCVLQFDHHCVWLGTCIGQKNHCKFWWYICEETTLCIWTLIMYVDYLSNVAKPWWKNAIIILLLVILAISLIFVMLLLIFHSYLILTNQSTYELVRRRRIPYMRNIPERVHPFSRGIRRNLYNVCCGNYNLDSLPTAFELEDRSRPYTCIDMLKCRCC
ncbi:Palmitoyltransferase DHHC domain [Arabidopsis thaliana x Arabidopsis arenosa]|uniref:S-acyltransferase n=1 Tax=Arabidopsis thaliana x Arabidopsis arenosa TaxID=1240361 RepID=A0A8T1ZM57_9BRAS|nr:Palmitoyltransferase DHHC domain [Arabidopsis thaliana x Arabidopsis arenosa]